jgi:hypothetical protein
MLEPQITQMTLIKTICEIGSTDILRYGELVLKLIHIKILIKMTQIKIVCEISVICGLFDCGFAEL